MTHRFSYEGLFASLFFIFVGQSGHTAPLDIFQECDECPEMIELPLGDFLMGGPVGDSRSDLNRTDGKPLNAPFDPEDLGGDERPLHQVTIDIPIAIGRNEITHDQWMACVNDGGCGGHIPDDTTYRNPARFEEFKVVVRGSHPVIDVSYLDALSYTAWLNGKVGADVYRLPTEGEWEYAARAGTQTRFAQGDELSLSQANFHQSEEWEQAQDDYPNVKVKGAPVPVEELDAANNWGVRHMSGNVVEMTASCWTDTYAGWPTSTEYLVQSKDVDCGIRVTRGGGYSISTEFLRVASRGGRTVERRSRYTGFRVVRELD